MPKKATTLTMPTEFYDAILSGAKDVHGLKVTDAAKEKWVAVSAAMLMYLATSTEQQRRFIREVRSATDAEYATLVQEAKSGELLRRVMRDRLNAGEQVSADEMDAVHEQTGTGSSSQGSNPTSTANPAEARGEGQRGARQRAARAAHK